MSDRPPRTPTPLAPSEDTLLSAPTPADRDELVDERLRHAEHQLDDLALRITTLERRAARPAKVPAWLPWITFLVVLAVLFRLFIAPR